MDEILMMSSVIAPVTLAVIQAIKQALWIDDKYYPLLAIFIGALLGVAAYFMDVEIGLRIWAGAISGLSAVGLFELGKQTYKE